MATIEEILTIKGPDVVIAPSTATVYEAARLMADANVGSVIVQDGEDVLGIFTERDLLQRVVAAGNDPAKTPLSQVMSAPVKSCGLQDDLQACTRRLTEADIRHLAVIEDGHLIGLIGLRDLMAAELSLCQKRLAGLEKLVADQQKPSE